MIIKGHVYFLFCVIFLLCSVGNGSSIIILPICPARAAGTTLGFDHFTSFQCVHLFNISYSESN